MELEGRQARCILTGAAGLSEGREEARHSRELIFIFVHRSVTSILPASVPHLQHADWRKTSLYGYCES